MSGNAILSASFIYVHLKYYSNIFIHFFFCAFFKDAPNEKTKQTKSECSK